MRRRGTRDQRRGFYRDCVRPGRDENAEHGELGEVRRRLLDALNRRPDELRLLVQGSSVLVRAARAERAMSPRGRNDLAASVTAVLEQLGDQLGPE